MSSGIPYDSDAGRQICGTLTAIMTGVSYATSAEMAAQLGAFPGYKKNREQMLRVVRNHRRAPMASAPATRKCDARRCRSTTSLPGSALHRARQARLGPALALGVEHGFRNAQVSVIAPTGTIALVMDCDTTGIEPISRW